MTIFVNILTYFYGNTPIKFEDIDKGGYFNYLKFK
jgi:hypothetical protein